MSVNDEWLQFLNKQYSITTSTRQNVLAKSTTTSAALATNINTNTEVCLDEIDEEDDAPACEDLYISTKTKVLFLNTPIDIYNIFWKIPVIEYWKTEEGVVKKQMKIVSKTPEEYEDYKKKL